MSMSYPFLFTPVVLYREDKPVYVVDGWLLANFPVWLFDGRTRRGRPGVRADGLDPDPPDQHHGSGSRRPTPTRSTHGA